MPATFKNRNPVSTRPAGLAKVLLNYRAIVKNIFLKDDSDDGLRMNSGAVSADGLLATVNFSQNVFFTESTIPNGMAITNITTGETATISAQIGSGTNQVGYTTSWPNSPLFGDTFKIEYDGLGDYVDEDSEPLKAQILNLQNQTINYESYF